jgi:hypothetical protein
MIDELSEEEAVVIIELGYMLLDDIGRMQQGNGTWSKIHKQDGKFIVTGTKYSNQNAERKEEYREVHNSIEDFKISRQQYI